MKPKESELGNVFHIAEVMYKDKLHMLKKGKGVFQKLKNNL